jgi:hypothetical protein
LDDPREIASAQCAQAPLELRAYDGVGRVSELVAPERRIGEQRLEHRQAGSGSIGEAGGDRTVELDRRL